MYLLQSWQESVEFLKIKNLKMLLLVTLKSIYSNYKFFSSMLLLFVLFEKSLWRLIFGVDIHIFDLIQKILLASFVFLFALIARPSIKRKTVSYFWDYKWHFVYWLITIILFFGVIFRTFRPFQILFLNPVNESIFFIAGVFFTLFWLDSRLRVKNLVFSLWRALKMFIFNFPFCFVCSIPYVILLFAGRFVYPGLLPKILELLLFIFYICFFTNFYTKRLHDQFALYFP
ncbi:hypothetical protein ACFLYU_02900 [Candidatus Dependentiae bacterium]